MKSLQSLTPCIGNDPIAAQVFASNSFQRLLELASTRDAIRPSCQAIQAMEELRAGSEIGPIPGTAIKQFNSAYYIRNFLKCSFAFTKLQPLFRHDIEFVDLGSGAGTFSLAAGGIRNSEDFSSKLYDRFDGQIELGRQLANELNFPGTFEFVKRDVQELPVESVIGKFALASYILAEFPQENTNINKLLFQSECALIVDYPSTISALARQAQMLQRPIIFETCFVSVPKHFQSSVGQARIRVAYAFIAG